MLKKTALDKVAKYIFHNSGIEEIVDACLHHTKDKISKSVMPNNRYRGAIATSIYHVLRTEWYILTNTNPYLSYLLKTRDNFQHIVPFYQPGGLVIFKHKTENKIVITRSWDDTILHLVCLYFPNYNEMEFVSYCIKQYEEFKRTQIQVKYNRCVVYEVYGKGNDSNFNIQLGSKTVPSNTDDDSEITIRSEDKISDVTRAYYNIDSMFDYNPTYDSCFMYEDVSEFEDDTNPFNNLYFSDDLMECVTRAQNWLVKADWYKQKHIPHKLGMLFEGVGGTGKSEMTKAIAETLGIPIYQYFLHTLNDKEFMKVWSGMETPCIALFEDFDNVFNKRTPVNRNQNLGFDTILNAISGVNSREGVMLVVTTNCLDKIDPAMGVNVSDTDDKGLSTRPGRIDMVKHFGNMDKTNRYKLANRILNEWPDLIEQVVNDNPEVTPAQFQEICVRAANEFFVNNVV